MSRKRQRTSQALAVAALAARSKGSSSTAVVGTSAFMPTPSFRTHPPARRPRAESKVHASAVKAPPETPVCSLPPAVRPLTQATSRSRREPSRPADDDRFGSAPSRSGVALNGEVSEEASLGVRRDQRGHDETADHTKGDSPLRHQVVQVGEPWAQALDGRGDYAEGTTDGLCHASQKRDGRTAAIANRRDLQQDLEKRVTDGTERLDHREAAPALLLKGQVGGTGKARPRAWERDSAETRALKRETENAVLQYASEGRWHKAVGALLADRRRGRQVTPRAYNTALRAVGQAGKVRQAIILINEIREQGYAVSQYNYGAAMHACAKAGAASSALLLLEEMRLDGLVPNEIVYSSAIKACEAEGRWHEALGMLERMEREGVPPNGRHFNAALSVVGKAGKFGRAMALLQERDSRGIQRDSFTWAAAIDAAGRAGKVQKAMQLLGDLLAAGGPSFNLIIFNAAAAACARATWPSDAVADAALCVLAEARARGLKPDQATYSGVMRALARAGRVGEALSLLDEMELVDGLRPNTFMYCNAVAACTVNERPWSPMQESSQNHEDCAHEGFVEHDVRQSAGVTRTTSHGAASQGAGAQCPRLPLLYSRQGWLSAEVVEENRGETEAIGIWGRREVGTIDAQALGDALLSRMGADRLEADPVLCVSLMTLWGKDPSGEGWRRAVHLLDLMRGSRRTPEGLLLPPADVLTYDHAMASCGACRQPDEAVRLLEGMEAAGVRPQVTSYVAAMRAMQAAGPTRATDVMSLFNDMRSAGIAPNLAAYTLAAGACASQGWWEQGIGLLKLMTRAWVAPTTRICNDVMMACALSKRWYRCVCILRGMGKEGRVDVPNAESYRIVIGSMCAAGEFSQAVGLLTSMTTAGLRVGAHEYDAVLTSASASSAGAGKARDRRRVVQQEAAETAAHAVTHLLLQVQQQTVRGAHEVDTFLPGLCHGVLELRVFRASAEVCLAARRPDFALKVLQGSKIVRQLRERLQADGQPVRVCHNSKRSADNAHDKKSDVDAHDLGDESAKLSALEQESQRRLKARRKSSIRGVVVHKGAEQETMPLIEEDKL